MSKLPPKPDNVSERTRLVHAGREPFEQHGFVNTPIYRGSTVLYPTTDDLLHRRGRYSYGTKGTPTTNSLETAWTELTGAAGTVLAPSGLAAVTVALMSCLKAGDHLLMTDSVYLPTRHFCNGILKKFGVETTYYDPPIGAGIEALLRPNTTAVFTEAPGSQSFEMQDIPAIAEVAHRHGAVVLMDNTWATPLLFPPHERGVDIAIEAGTKYLSGGSDLLLGLVSANERCFKALRDAYDSFAMCPGPEDVFLGLRGLRTMALRLREHEKQALDMARWLAGPSRGGAGAAPGARELSGPRDLEAGLQRLVGPVLDHPQALLGPGARRHARRARPVRHGLFLGRVREPRDPLQLRQLPHRDPLGARRPLRLRFHIGLEDLDDLKRDLDAGFARLREAD